MKLVIECEECSEEKRNDPYFGSHWIETFEDNLSKAIEHYLTTKHEITIRLEEIYDDD